MAITGIPTRTTADPNSAADINTLMANDTALYASLGVVEAYFASAATGAMLQYDGTAWAQITAGSGGQVLTFNATTGTAYWATPSAGGTKPDHIENIEPGRWFHIADGGELDRDSGSNGYNWRILLATGDEVQGPNLIFPSDLNTSGTVTIRAYGYAETTPTGAKQTELLFSYSTGSDAKSWDVAYATASSGDITISTAADRSELFEWTIPASVFTSKCKARIKLGRIAPTGTDLTGNLGVEAVQLSIPRA